MTTLRRVAWCNIWNYAQAMHSDVGSLTHLTLEGKVGKTLCGRKYPADKGFPAYGRLCRKCRNLAEKSYPGFIFSQLEWLN